MTAEASTQELPPLIGPDDPPPVSIINESGTARLLLTGDHVSNAFPGSMNNLGLEDWVLGRHVAYDIGTYKLLNRLSQLLDAPAVLAGYSRLLVDLNRSLEDPSVMPEVSDFIPIPGNQNLNRAQKALRVHSFYTPYRETIDDMLYRLRTRDQVPALIAIHSFTPVMSGQRRPWHIGVLWDKDPRIPVPLIKRLRSHPENLVIGDNQPYSGKHPADYTIDHHGEAAGLPHVSVEFRQDLIDTDAGAERWASILAEELSDILANPGLYRLLGS